MFKSSKMVRAPRNENFKNDAMRSDSAHDMSSILSFIKLYIINKIGHHKTCNPITKEYKRRNGIESISTIFHRNIITMK